MRRGLVFILALAGCPSAPPPPVPRGEPGPIVARAPDAMPDAAAPVTPGDRGARCSAVAACAAGLVCDPLPGGYCASECEAGCCTPFATGPDRCMARCARDADCREDEGYVCDAQWRACVLPNTTAIVPNRCWLSHQPVEAGWGEPVEASEASDAPAEAIAFDECGERDCGEQRRAGDVLIYALAGGIRTRTTPDGGRTWREAQTPVLGERADVVASGRRAFVAALVGNRLGAYGSAEQRVDLASSRDGGATWSAPVTVSGRDETIPFFLSGPAIAYDARRDLVYVAYVRGGRRGVWDLVIATGKVVPKGDRVWTRTAIGDGCVLHELPALAVEPASGIVHVAYFDSGAGGLVHATCAGGRCTERGLISAAEVTTLPRAMGARTQLAFERGKLVATFVMRGRTLVARMR